MKALEILKEFKIIEINWGQTPFQISEYDEAIAELEALQAIKTCEGCESQHNMDNDCFRCSRYHHDYYEPKESK